MSGDDLKIKTMSIPMLMGYHIERLQATGTFTKTWSACHSADNRPVYITFFSAGISCQARIQQVMNPTIQKLKEIRNTLIAPILDFGQIPANNQYYVISEDTGGIPLPAWLKMQGRLDPADALILAGGIAQALATAWDQGHIIHGDLRPENLIVHDGHTRLILNTGLAPIIFVLQAVGDTHEWTINENVIPYVAPELIENFTRLSCQADIYGLGAVLFELTTGVPPYHGLSVLDILERKRVYDAPDPRDINASIPDSVSHQVRRLMACRPEDRPATWNDVLTALMTAHTGLASVHVAAQSPGLEPSEAPRAPHSAPVKRNDASTLLPVSLDKMPDSDPSPVLSHATPPPTKFRLQTVVITIMLTVIVLSVGFLIHRIRQSTEALKEILIQSRQETNVIAAIALLEKGVKAYPLAGNSDQVTLTLKEWKQTQIENENLAAIIQKGKVAKPDRASIALLQEGILKNSRSVLIPEAQALLTELRAAKSDTEILGMAMARADQEPKPSERILILERALKECPHAKNHDQVKLLIAEIRRAVADTDALTRALRDARANSDFRVAYIELQKAINSFPEALNRLEATQLASQLAIMAPASPDTLSASDPMDALLKQVREETSGVTAIGLLKDAIAQNPKSPRYGEAKQLLATYEKKRQASHQAPASNSSHTAAPISNAPAVSSLYAFFTAGKNALADTLPVSLINDPAMEGGKASQYKLSVGMKISKKKEKSTASELITVIQDDSIRYVPRIILGGVNQSLPEGYSLVLQYYVSPLDNNDRDDRVLMYSEEIIPLSKVPSGEMIGLDANGLECRERVVQPKRGGKRTVSGEDYAGLIITLFNEERRVVARKTSARRLLKELNQTLPP